VKAVHARYLLYSLLRREYIGEVDASSYGSKMPRASWDNVRGSLHWVPGWREQQAIADFLDRETARIDKLIGKQEQLIATLEERRQAFIAATLSAAEATTGAFKIKLRWHFRFMNGDRGENYPSASELVSEGIPFINAGDLKGGRLDFSALSYVTTEKYQSMGGAKLRGGDILYCLRGSVGKNALVSGLEHGALASSLVALRNVSPARVDTRYVSWLLNSPAEVAQRHQQMSGSAQPNLSAESLSSMVFWLPDIQIQRQVLGEIGDYTMKLDALVVKARETVDVLLERRQALISAAVTGKLEVGL
jgi:type I restriction enzyme S subunit